MFPASVRMLPARVYGMTLLVNRVFSGGHRAFVPDTARFVRGDDLVASAWRAWQAARDRRADAPVRAVPV